MNTGRTCLPRCGAGTVSGPLLTGMGSTGASTVAVEFVAGLEKSAYVFRRNIGFHDVRGREHEAAAFVHFW
jgi:hypothetical protein